MRHIIGLSSATGDERRWPLDTEGRIRFDTDDVQSMGYFNLFAEAFDGYARRDAGVGIGTINVLFSSQGR